MLRESVAGDEERHGGSRCEVMGDRGERQHGMAVKLISVPCEPTSGTRLETQLKLSQEQLST